MEAGDGMPCSSKDTENIDDLGVMEVPMSGQIGMRPSPTGKVTGSITQLKCSYTDKCSVGNEQEELEVIVHQGKDDAVAITETWWDNSHT